jgi:2-oxoglutarate dehydrogenase E2 component (dihydrolipoamide succinyltransferase)
MSEFKVRMPKMGESVEEATITKWFVKEGDKIKEDDLLFEIATEKVDSEIPSPVDGVLKKIFFEVDSVVAVGETVALIETGEEAEGDDTATDVDETVADKNKNQDEKKPADKQPDGNGDGFKSGSRFYSPLVRSIATKEDISLEELESIEGSDLNGRVQKKDVLAYLETRGTGKQTGSGQKTSTEKPAAKPEQKQKAPVSIGAEDQIVEMDRVRKLIAGHMVNSAQTAPHVTNVVEADVTNLVLWRNKVKNEFQEKYGQKITYMPVFIEAVATALREFPGVNASVDGDKIILRGRVNIGIAVAKPDGNLVVPVINDADQKNLVGLTSSLNDLANRARNNKLLPDEISGGTFSITNFGTFRNIMGTPIINQPQAAILATGSIEKKPAVMETPTGDAIVVRHKMFLSLSYDHRIVDGALGGAFLRSVADLLEEFDVNRKI